MRENASRLKTEVLDGLESLREKDKAYGMYKMSKSSDATIFTSCFAVFIRNLFDDLKNLTDEERNQWIGLISGCQDEKTGLFTDPGISERKLTEEHDLNYVTWQLTTFCISALQALGAEIKYPLRFLEKWKNRDTIINWLEQQNWNNPWNVGNVVMFLGIMLITDYELTRDYNSKNTSDVILDWYDQFQNPETGFWGKGRRSLYFEGLYGACHQYLLYYYLNRPIEYMDKIVDRTLLLQQEDGLFSPQGGGGACEDYDAIDTLVNMYKRINYRRGDIKNALRRAYLSLLAMQNDDGGFLWAKRRRFGVFDWLKRLSSVFKYKDFYYWYYINRKALGGQIRLKEARLPIGWVKEEIPLDESDIFTTWLRCTSLGLICQVLNNVCPKNLKWNFLKTCGLGWHK